MTVWAIPCRICSEPERVCYIDAAKVAEFPATTRIVQVRIGKDWRCAELDRQTRIEVEAMLLRDVAATNAIDCSGCHDA